MNPLRGFIFKIPPLFAQAGPTDIGVLLLINHKRVILRRKSMDCIHKVLDLVCDDE